MYQHERSLVQKYKNRPFVLMGINTDDKSQLKEIMQRNNLTWNSWADGPAGSFGPLVRTWAIRAFPTLILIDGNGKIRKRNLREDKLDDAIEQLVRETEQANGATANAASSAGSPAPASTSAETTAPPEVRAKEPDPGSR